MNSLLLVILFCGVVVFCDPPHPQISSTFFAKLSITQDLGRDYWEGPGVQACDVEAGKALISFNLDGNVGQKYYHLLDRYDLNETYSLDVHGECTEGKTSGSLTNPWEWVPNAYFTGQYTYHGILLDGWAANDTTTGTSYALSVYDSDPNIPIFLQSNTTVNGSLSQTYILFEQFNTTFPLDWVFAIPNNCPRS